MKIIKQNPPSAGSRRQHLPRTTRLPRRQRPRRDDVHPVDGRALQPDEPAEPPQANEQERSLRRADRDGGARGPSAGSWSSPWPIRAIPPTTRHCRGRRTVRRSRPARSPSTPSTPRPPATPATSTSTRWCCLTVWTPRRPGADCAIGGLCPLVQPAGSRTQVAQRSRRSRGAQ